MLDLSPIQLIHPDRANAVSAASARVEVAMAPDGEISRAHLQVEDDDFWDPAFGMLRPYNVRNGILTIPVRGYLAHRFPYALGGIATGYDYIERAVKRGYDDDEVETIILDVHSGGGAAAGAFDAADAIYNMRGRKPIVAIAADTAFSGAYAIASAADDLVMTRTGMVGSVGVVMTHVDMSKMLEDDGIKVSYIYAGEKKVMGNPTEPLTDEARARMQEEVDDLYTLFVDAVARNRGLTPQQVRSTEAATYISREAVELGLADRVSTLGSVMAEYADETAEEGGKGMSKDNQQAAPGSAEQDRAAIDAAKTAGVSEGRAEERARISSILDCDEAKGREAVARKVAFNTDMDADAAKAFLADLPTASVEDASPAPQTGGSPFEAAMAATGNPEVGVGAPEPSAQEASFADKFFAQMGVSPRRQ